MEIGFSLGSNMYNRKRLLMQAKNLISTAPRTRFLEQSPIYETTPVEMDGGRETPPLFLNAVVLFESKLPPDSWISYIEKIEKNLGRVRRSGEGNVSRPIDIDIIFANGLEIDEPNLQIPHPRWNQRRFVVQPLCDIRPELVLPGETRTVREVLRALPVDENMQRFEERW